MLAFAAAKDFEAPDDADNDGDYQLTVRVTDGANPVEAPLTVSLTDLDEIAPALTGASVNGTLLTLSFDEALDQDAAPAADAFAVTVAGTARDVESLSLSLSGSAVELTLAAAVAAGESVTVGYTPPTERMPLRCACGRQRRGRLLRPRGHQPDPGADAGRGVDRGDRSPVTEGAAAAFTLRRTGAVTAALT